jgi:hypothetical protein
MRFFIPAACAAALFFLSCSLEPLSGGGTEGGNTVSGVFINGDGSASAKVKVLLIPSDYDPGAVRQNGSIVASVTSNSGGYSFEHVPRGSYSIEATDTANGKMSLITEVDVSGENYRVPVDTLRVPGAMMVFLPPTADIASGYFFVPGTSRYVRLAGAAGYVVMTALPAKPLPAICYATLSDPTPVVMRYNVRVVSGDTTVVANAGWKFSRRLGLNTAATGVGVSQNIAGFPVVVRLTKDNFDFTQANAGGSDVRFFRPDTVTLPYEIERWDAAGQKAEIWVRVDTIYGNNDAQSITMYWGNTDAGDKSDGSAVFDTSNGFIGVWHMNEDPSAGTASIKDRTVNAHGATPFGQMTTANSVDGAVGKALSFDGKKGYLNAGNVSVPGKYSVGLWVLMDTLGDYQRFIYKDSSYTLWYDKDSVSVRMEHFSNSTWWKGLLQDGGTRVPMTTGTWYYLTATFDGTVIRLYKNGTEASVSNPIAVSPRTNTQPLVFGKSYTDPNDPLVYGIMDEIRIEGVARSADWIRLCYMNQRVDDKLVKNNK